VAANFRQIDDKDNPRSLSNSFYENKIKLFCIVMKNYKPIKLQTI
jgi:hypothetical protein